MLNVTDREKMVYTGSHYYYYYSKAHEAVRKTITNTKEIQKDEDHE